MRQLKHHEKKLLKKVDFFSWKEDQNVREAAIIRKYLLQDREDYIKYNKMVGHITKLVGKLKNLATEDPKNCFTQNISLFNMFQLIHLN